MIIMNFSHHTVDAGFAVALGSTTRRTGCALTFTPQVALASASKAAPVDFDLPEAFLTSDDKRSARMKRIRGIDIQPSLLSEHQEKEEYFDCLHWHDRVLR
jgi:hypothetical protein